jgi:hypothetical protein
MLEHSITFRRGGRGIERMIRTGCEAVYEVIDGEQKPPAVQLDGRAELQQQRLLVADLLAVFAGTVSEYAQLAVVESIDGGQHIVYRLADHCKCCSAFVQDTVAKCAPAHRATTRSMRALHRRCQAEAFTILLLMTGAMF